MKPSMLILTVAGAIAAGIALSLLVLPTGLPDDFTMSRHPGWEMKKREHTTRLNEVPIILYHNIDGKGAFSIDRATLREHFEFFRKNGVRVISLAELVRRMEDPRPCHDRSLVITFDDGYFAMYSKLLPIVREFGYPVTLFVYADAIFTSANTSLTWDRLREMDRSGIDIQCHTISHTDLTRLAVSIDSDASRKLYEELYLSRRLLEVQLGKRIRFLAYPYGRYDDRIIALSTYAGYQRVFSTDYGTNLITRNNYCLRRRHIKRDYTLAMIEKIIL